jgi:hypothetical protein
MKWRQQIGAALCGIFFLGVIAAVAIRTMAPGVARGEFKSDSADTPASQLMFANHLNTTSRVKTQPIRPRLLPQPSPLEFTSPGDVGSLWDEGPAYDLSR